MNGEYLSSLPNIMLLNTKQSIGGSFSLDSDGELEGLVTSSKPLKKWK